MKIIEFDKGGMGFLDSLNIMREGSLTAAVIFGSCTERIRHVRVVSNRAAAKETLIKYTYNDKSNL